MVIDGISVIMITEVETLEQIEYLNKILSKRYKPSFSFHLPALSLSGADSHPQGKFGGFGTCKHQVVYKGI
jgi:hypothetical protein